MGVGEWIALVGLAIAMIASVIKAMNDKTELTTKLASLEKWRDKMEGSELMDCVQYEKSRSECRAEIYRDIGRIDRKSEDFLRIIELQNSKISEVRENVIKILTLLEGKTIGKG